MGETSPPNDLVNLPWGLGSSTVEQATVFATVAAGLAGLAGAILGGLLAAWGSRWATRQQLAQQAREMRGQVYSEFLAAYLAMTQQTFTQQFFASRSHETHQQLDQIRGHQSRRQWRQTPGSPDAAAVERLQREHDTAVVKHQEAGDRFDTIYNALITQMHRVRIFAPEVISDVTQVLYDLHTRQLSLLWEIDPEMRMAHGEWQRSASTVFGDLARADVQASGSSSWKTGAKQAIAFVGSARSFIEHFDEHSARTDPEQSQP